MKTIDELLRDLQVETAGADCHAWASVVRKVRTMVSRVEKRSEAMRERLVIDIMKRFGIPKKDFLIVQGWDICTKKGTILCGKGFTNPHGWPRWMPAQQKAETQLGTNCQQAEGRSMTGNEDEDWHVIPTGDFRAHVANRDCWCHPEQDEEEPRVWVHNALDQRERFETKGHDA